MTARTVTPPSEIAMQQAWRFRLWGTGRLATSQGKWVEVLDAGKLNNGPGPDFRDARIRVDGRVWVGSIEIHRRASDWLRHGHDGDNAYANVILHVVGDDDCRINRPDGTEVLQTVMSIDEGFAPLFNGLLNSQRYVLPMCGDSLSEVEDIFRTDWLTALAFERLNRKADDVTERLNSVSGDWLQTVFVTLARGLGFGANADNMERMARSVPVRRLLQHSDNIETVEAMLFGQAGLLSAQNPADSYEKYLMSEYAFYARKFGLAPIERPVWQMSARNMSNTPHRRIALLAAIVRQYGSDLARRLAGDAVAPGKILFSDVTLSEYWTYSYAFGRTSGSRLSTMGRQSRELLLINVIAPLVYARGLATGRYEYLDRAVALWESLPGEQNSITKGFEAHGIEIRDAFTGQALIQLHREYCERRRCPECRLGHRLLSSFIAFPTHHAD